VPDENRRAARLDEPNVCYLGGKEGFGKGCNSLAFFSSWKRSASALGSELSPNR